MSHSSNWHYKAIQFCTFLTCYLLSISLLPGKLSKNFSKRVRDPFSLILQMVPHRQVKKQQVSHKTSCFLYLQLVISCPLIYYKSWLMDHNIIIESQSLAGITPTCADGKVRSDGLWCLLSNCCCLPSFITSKQCLYDQTRHGLHHCTSLSLQRSQNRLTLPL